MTTTMPTAHPDSQADHEGPTPLGSLTESIAPQSRRSSPRKSTEELIKLVIFPLGTLLLAAPMNRISRVIHCPQIYSSGLGSVGVATVGDRELTIVDLHQELFHSPSPRGADQPGYLVLTPTPSGELMGIPTPETPLLLEIPTKLVRLLPDSYRQADTLWVASHMARMPLAEGQPPQSIFVLDMAAVVERIGHRNQA
jgi:chemotaxis signal transduction protein